MAQTKKPTKSKPNTSTQPKKDETKPPVSTTNPTNNTIPQQPEDIITEKKSKPEKTWYKCDICRYKTTIANQKVCPVDNSNLQISKNN